MRFLYRYFVLFCSVQRLLRDSLGGNCRTTIIATIAPYSNLLDETMSTLHFAGA